MTRRLAALLAADVVGYSRLMEADETGTLAALKQVRAELIDPKIAEHQGRIVKTAGDGMLVEFGSAVEAVLCAIEVQRQMTARNAEIAAARRFEFRIGINLGDVIVEADDVNGDGVNIAARLEQAAPPGGVVVSEDVYRQVIGKVPAPLEDLGQLALKNLSRPLGAYLVRPEGAQGAPRRLPLPDKPSLAVLPFDNLTGDPEQEHLVDGMVEEIIAALSRVKSFFVIARNSTFTYKGKAVRVDQVGRELGVRYVVEGSVRMAGNRIRLTAQLIEAESGRHVWAGNFEGMLDDVFALQDRITEQVVGALHPSIRLAEIERARRKRPENLDAYDYTMRALPHVWALQRDDNAKATDLLEHAIARDPEYPMALALAAWCQAQQITYLWSADIEASKERALRYAERAARADDADPLVLTLLATAQMLVHRLDEAESQLARALAIDPNLAWGWNRSGWLHVYRGEPETAIEHFERAIRLSPLDSMNFNCCFGIGAAHFVATRDEEAVSWIKKGIAERPGAIWVFRLLVATYGNLGRIDEARPYVDALRREYPRITLADVAKATPLFSDRYLAGLKKVGWPE